MSRRLTDEELTRLEDDPRSPLIYDALAELRAHRQAALTAEERGALRNALVCVMNHGSPHRGVTDEECRRAMLVLSRLLGKEEG